MKKNSIRYRIREKIIANVSKKSKRNVIFPQLKKIDTVGIICNNDQHCFMPHGSFFSNFRVVKLVFNNQKRHKMHTDVAIYSSDYNIIGLPKKKWINVFIKQRFSILIDFTNGDNRVVEYICALSNAKFIVGTNPKSKVYDLIINQKFVNSSDLIDEIEKTLQNLN